MSEAFFRRTVDFVRNVFGGEGTIPLHAPRFSGNERAYVADTIESTMVSSVGAYVTSFEDRVREFTGAKYAVATSNGTVALQVALQLVGVSHQDEVLAPALSFVATANAVVHAGGVPVFIDSERETLGISPDALLAFLERSAERRADGCYDRQTGRRIAACVPMHTFGHPVRIERIVDVCRTYGIPVVEDAAESLGSWNHGRHTGLFGTVGTLSFNGNKTVTTGGGGMIITDDASIGARAKHITTTAKRPHPYEFFHDEVGYNFRLPNLNAALGCAQMERLPDFIASKRELARMYRDFFADEGVPFVTERDGTTVNYWLNCIVLKDRAERDAFLTYTNAHGVMTRPIWTLMNKLPMYASNPAGDLSVAQWLEDRVVNLPSSARV